MATHFSILAWEIPRTEEPGGLQFQGVAKSRTWLSMHTQPYNHSYQKSSYKVSLEAQIPIYSLPECFQGKGTGRKPFGQECHHWNVQPALFWHTQWCVQSSAVYLMELTSCHHPGPSPKSRHTCKTIELCDVDKVRQATWRQWLHLPFQMPHFWQSFGMGLFFFFPKQRSKENRGKAFKGTHNTKGSHPWGCVQAKSNYMIMATNIKVDEFCCHNEFPHVYRLSSRNFWFR